MQTKNTKASTSPLTLVFIFFPWLLWDGFALLRVCSGTGVGETRSWHIHLRLALSKGRGRWRLKIKVSEHAGLRWPICLETARDGCRSLSWPRRNSNCAAAVPPLQTRACSPHWKGKRCIIVCHRTGEKVWSSWTFAGLLRMAVTLGGFLQTLWLTKHPFSPAQGEQTLWGI